MYPTTLIGMLVGSATLAATGAAVAASQLRQRPAVSTSRKEGDEDAGGGGSDEEQQPLQGGWAQAAKKSSTRQVALAVTVAVVAAFVLSGAIIYTFVGGLLWQKHGPGSCPVPPTVGARLKHAAALGYSRPINTQSKEAQQLFDLGLVEEFNYNQVEANAAFRQAAEKDPLCSRCWWGVSYALGPGANRAAVPKETPWPSFSPADFPDAQRAAKTALRLAREAVAQQPQSQAALADVEWAEAAVARFPDGSEYGAARDAAELHYAQLVATIGRRDKDADALAIAAESHMNVSPWDYYQANRTLRPTAVAAEALLQEALAVQPRHPLALHLHIHVAEEASPLRVNAAAGLSAARAEQAADTMLQGAGPWSSMGHLLHMPSHTFVRIGRYADAVTANVRAFAADLADTRACRTPYVPEHNADLLVYAAVAGGQRATARKWAAELTRMQRTLHTASYGDGTYHWTWRQLVRVAFADWDAVLSSEAPDARARGNCPHPVAADYALAVWHYSRGLAYVNRAAAVARADEPTASATLSGYAAEELSRFQAIAKRVVPEEGTLPGAYPGVYGCDYKRLLNIYGPILHAALLWQQGSLNEAVVVLKGAVAEEDQMGYFEPPRLYLPVRQCLGAALLSAGRHQEAEQAFRQDLEQHPEGGRSLEGLARALQGQGQDGAAHSVRSGPLATAWQHADVPAKPCAQLGQLVHGH